MSASRDDATLARLIRRSPVLDASARRHWLAVLPHLSPDDRERLREILTEPGPLPATRSPAHRRAEDDGT